MRRFRKGDLVVSAMGSDKRVYKVRDVAPGAIRIAVQHWEAAHRWRCVDEADVDRSRGWPVLKADAAHLYAAEAQS